MKSHYEMSVRGRSQTNLVSKSLPANANKGNKNSGSVTGTHYDPENAVATRNMMKKRPAPVPGVQHKGQNIKAQPT